MQTYHVEKLEGKAALPWDQGIVQRQSDVISIRGSV